MLYMIYTHDKYMCWYMEFWLRARTFIPVNVVPCSKLAYHECLPEPLASSVSFGDSCCGPVLKKRHYKPR